MPETNGQNGTTPITPPLEFTPNVPQLVAIKFATPKLYQNGTRAGYTLVDGRRMFVDIAVAEQIGATGVKPMEPFNIRQTWSGKRGDPKTFDVWLTREAEVSRAREENPEARFNSSKGATAPPAAPRSDQTAPAASQPLSEDETAWRLRKSLELDALMRELKERGVLPKNGTAAPNPAKVNAAAPTPSHFSEGFESSAASNGSTTLMGSILCRIANALLEAERHASHIGYAAWPKQFTSEDVRTFANTMFINETGGRK